MNDELTVTAHDTDAAAAAAGDRYDFSFPTMAVPVNTAPAGKPAVFATHVIAIPDLDQLAERERLSRYETEEVTRNEDTIRADDDKANDYLFETIGRTLTGYVFEKTPDDIKADRKKTLAFKLEKSRLVRETKEHLGDIPAGHKRAVLQALHAVNAQREFDPDEQWVDLSGDDDTQFLRVTVEIGPKSKPDYTLVFVCRKPDEDEKSRYRRAVAEVRSVKGSRKSRQRIVTNIRAGVAAFDRMIERVEGGSIGEKASEQCSKRELVGAVNAIIKRAVAAEVMGADEADCSD